MIKIYIQPVVVLITNSGICESRGETRRLIKQKGISFDDIRGDSHWRWTPQEFSALFFSKEPFEPICFHWDYRPYIKLRPDIFELDYELYYIKGDIMEYFKLQNKFGYVISS